MMVMINHDSDSCGRLDDTGDTHYDGVSIIILYSQYPEAHTEQSSRLRYDYIENVLEN